MLKQNKAYVDQTIGKTLKPIIDPLDKLVSLSKIKNITTLNKTDDKKYFNSTRNNIHEINHNKNTDLDATFDDDGMRYESVFSDDDDKASYTLIANKTLSSQYLKTLNKKQLILINCMEFERLIVNFILVIVKYFLLMTIL